MTFTAACHMLFRRARIFTTMAAAIGGSLLLACTPLSQRHAAVPQPPAAIPVSATDTAVSHMPPPLPAIGEGEYAAIDPAQWPGRRFVILKKVRMFQRFGFELYASPRLSEETATPQTEVELDNHRLRYEPFAGSSITTVKAEPLSGGEYLVSFTTDTLNLTVYAKTKLGIVEGIVDAGDLDKARARWSGRTIYSRRRLIDIYDSAASRFSSVSVSITEPLEVVGVEWGMVPLPPKPIWIRVRRADGTTGIIPVHFTWTNVSPKSRSAGLPWERDVLEQDPRRLYSWDSEIWDAIDSHKILTGMSARQVELSWGPPKLVQTEAEHDNRKAERWHYDGTVLVFMGDSVAAEVHEEKASPEADFGKRSRKPETRSGAGAK